MTGVSVVIDADGHVEIRLTPDSRLLQERLGMTAWVALEALVFGATPDNQGGVTVAVSARDLAARLGIGKDRAAAALAVLRDAEVIVRIAVSSGPSARFVAHRYEIRLPVSRAADAVTVADDAGRKGEAHRVKRDSARLFDVGS